MPPCLLSARHSPHSVRRHDAADTCGPYSTPEGIGSAHLRLCCPLHCATMESGCGVRRCRRGLGPWCHHGDGEGAMSTETELSAGKRAIEDLPPAPVAWREGTRTRAAEL